MTIHTEVLSPVQQDILLDLGKFATEQGFYLGGDTATALYLGHRHSIDYDWFSLDKIDDPLALAEKARLSGLDIENVQVSPGMLHSSIHGIQISFFEYLYKPIANFTFWLDFSINLASLDDLACMKLAAIAQRGSRKDFIDIHSIALHYKPLHDLLELYRRKYSTDDITHILIGLTYFDDAEEEPSPIMLHEISWDEIKRQFQEWTKGLAG